MAPSFIDHTACEIDGAGPPIVLVHGMGLNRRMWDWQLDTLTPHFSVVRYDLLGHGDSGDPTLPCRMDHLVEQLAILTERLDLGPFGLVGFSLGGLVVRAFALAHPVRVAALGILNSAHDRSPDQRAAMQRRLAQAQEHGPATTTDAALKRWFTDAFADRHPEVLDRVRRWMAANDPRIYPEIYRILAEGDVDLARSIAAIRCPTLVLACEDDHGNSPQMARGMAELIPDARCEIVLGLRHMGLVEDPQAVGSILVPFLKDAFRPG